MDVDLFAGRVFERRFFPMIAGELGAELDVDRALASKCTPRRRVKEASKPKLYLFNAGVVRALAGLLREPIEKAERGTLHERLVLHPWARRSIWARQP